MTSKNLNLMNRPFLLSPAGKDYLWGGNRLRTEYNKNIALSPLAETWECSTHPDGPSTVIGGGFDGRTLTDVLEQHPEYMGSHPLSLIRTTDDEENTDTSLSLQLPIMIKLIDAKENLSIQVHPDDAYAREQENGSLGKTEMWYVLDAVPNSGLIYGFNRDMSPALLQRSLKDGTIEKYLQKIPVHKDDVFYIESGTVHAIGAGTLLAEIQENSNLTYRLYDYDRTDHNGKKRELHIEKALDVLNYRSSENPRQPIRVLRYHPGCASELLCRCRYFQVERLLINTEYCADLPECSTGGNSFHVLLCVDGEGSLLENDPTLQKQQLPFSKGSCLFLPANSVPLKLQGKAQLLRVSC